MEFSVIEESKNRLVFDLAGENHTFCNALKEQLLLVDGVSLATYSIAHPLVGQPRFVLETKGAEPRKALKTALKALSKKADAFAKSAASL